LVIDDGGEKNEGKKLYVNGFVENNGEKVIMKTMERTGLLEQFLHCSTIPKVYWDKNTSYGNYLNLLNAPTLIWNKSGCESACGDKAKMLF
jgi:hypothetical protein